MSPKKAKPKGKGPAPSRAVGTQAGPSAGDRILGYPLPKEVAAAVDKATQANQASNFGLLFHRLLRYPNAPWEWSLEGKDKADAWNQVVRKALSIFQNATMKGLFEDLQKRMTWGEQGYRQRFGPNGVISFPMTVDWRLAIGFSAPSVLETGIALHRIYGIPYLPGSAVKGLTRHFRLAMIAEELGVPVLDPEEIKRRHEQKRKTPWEMLEELLVAEEPKDERSREDLEKSFRRLQDDPEVQKVNKPDGLRTLGLSAFQTKYATAFRRAFGSTARRGEVLFFDAFPEKVTEQEDGRNEPIVEVELDIINTHYQAYYTGNPPKPPADYLSPIPVYFLTVRAGTPFRFRLAAKDPNLLGTVVSWLKEALHKFGIGAKTMAGYGAMS